MALTDATQSELAEKLARVREGEAHLRSGAFAPSPDSPDNLVLRLPDIQRYIGATRRQIEHWFPCLPRVRKVSVPRAGIPNPYRMPEEKRAALAAFFADWDRGLIVKARVGDEWKLCERYPNSPPLGTASRQEAPPRTMKLTVDWNNCRFK